MGKQYSSKPHSKMNKSMKNISTMEKSMKNIEIMESQLVQCYDNPPEIDPYTYIILSSL